MIKTKHFSKRVNQRGIPGDLIPLVTKYGVRKGDKHILCKKDADTLVQGLNRLKRELQIAQAKGRSVVVGADGRLAFFSN